MEEGRLKRDIDVAAEAVFFGDLSRVDDVEFRPLARELAADVSGNFPLKFCLLYTSRCV